MRILLYIVILASLLFAPIKGLDVAHLEPVEVVWIYEDDGMIFLTTDTGALGAGEDVLSALCDLEARTSGVVYLDTAKYLLVEESAQGEVEALRSRLNGTVRLCLAKAPDMEIAAKFLETHSDLPLLREWNMGEELPVWNGKIFS